MSSAKLKLSQKTSAVKPIIKKLCNTHKKWLGTDKSTDKRKGVKATPPAVEHEDEEHFKNTKYDNVFMDTSIESTVTVVDVSSSPEKNNKTVIEVKAPIPMKRKAQKKQENVTTIVIDDCVEIEKKSEKLRNAIETFDKLLDEYALKSKIPKLQKSKTCSIIESKCILKKTVSVPLDECSKSMNFMPEKTKSLYDLEDSRIIDLSFYVTPKEKFDKELKENKKFIEKHEEEKSSVKISGLEKSDVKEIGLKKFHLNLEESGLEEISKINRKEKIAENVHSESKKSQHKEMSSKIKEAVDKFSNIREVSSLKSVEVNNVPTTNVKKKSENFFKTPPLELKVFDVNYEDEEKNFKDEKLITEKFERKLSKAFSYYDISQSGKKFQSKIPIKTNLNRTYPSTPSNLNDLDCKNGSALGSKKGNDQRNNSKFDDLNKLDDPNSKKFDVGAKKFVKKPEVTNIKKFDFHDGTSKLHSGMKLSAKSASNTNLIKKNDGFSSCLSGGGGKKSNFQKSASVHNLSGKLSAYRNNLNEEKTSSDERLMGERKSCERDYVALKKPLRNIEVSVNSGPALKKSANNANCYDETNNGSSNGNCDNLNLTEINSTNCIKNISNNHLKNSSNYLMKSNVTNHIKSSKVISIKSNSISYIKDNSANCIKSHNNGTNSIRSNSTKPTNDDGINLTNDNAKNFKTNCSSNIINDSSTNLKYKSSTNIINGSSGKLTNEIGNKFTNNKGNKHKNDSDNKLTNESGNYSANLIYDKNSNLKNNSNFNFTNDSIKNSNNNNQKTTNNVDIKSNNYPHTNNVNAFNFNSTKDLNSIQTKTQNNTQQYKKIAIEKRFSSPIQSYRVDTGFESKTQNDTFGTTKGNFESKFASHFENVSGGGQKIDVKRSQTYKITKSLSRTVSVVNETKTETNRAKAEGVLISKEKGVDETVVENEGIFCLESEGFTNRSLRDKSKGYCSDENSDDSGNISNELEGDCDVSFGNSADVGEVPGDRSKRDQLKKPEEVYVYETYKINLLQRKFL